MKAIQTELVMRQGKYSKIITHVTGKEKVKLCHCTYFLAKQVDKIKTYRFLYIKEWIKF